MALFLMLPQDSVARDICSQQVCEHSASVLNVVAFAVGKTLDQESEWYKQHTSSQGDKVNFGDYGVGEDGRISCVCVSRSVMSDSLQPHGL